MLHLCNWFSTRGGGSCSSIHHADSTTGGPRHMSHKVVPLRICHWKQRQVVVFIKECEDNARFEARRRLSTFHDKHICRLCETRLPLVHWPRRTNEVEPKCRLPHRGAGRCLLASILVADMLKEVGQAWSGTNKIGHLPQTKKNRCFLLYAPGALIVQPHSWNARLAHIHGNASQIALRFRGFLVHHIGQ